MKKKRKRKKSSARRASDSSEEESDAESKVSHSVTDGSFLFFGSWNLSVVLKMYRHMAETYLNVSLPKKKKRRLKEEGDKEKVVLIHQAN